MNVESLVRQVTDQLTAFGLEIDNLSLREKVLRLADVLRSTKKLGVVVVRQGGCDAKGARERIRLYLTAYVGQVIGGDELEIVSGISEYARRLRELRVQDGYSIVSGLGSDPSLGLEIKPNQYVLLRPEADATAARRWYVANRIRKQGGSAQSRMLDYLQANVAQVVTSEELAYVAKVREFGRRVRELRTEQGFLVATIYTGRPDLRPGEYVLETTDRVAEPHDRHIPTEVQEAVYARDDNACRICGWNRAFWTRQDPRFLELHHLVGHRSRGANTADNLLVLCNVCHDDVHAGRKQAPEP